MSAVAIPTRETLLVRPTPGGPTGRQAEPSRRSIATAGVSAGRGECTCPSDCDRDHPNE
jgi:hypothetical protein